MDEIDVPKIQNLFHCMANNVGDRMCGPAQYLWPKESVNLPLQMPLHVGNNLLIGGGQVFDQALEISVAVRKINLGKKIVAWGIGLPPIGKRKDDINYLMSNTDLLGTRDYTYCDQLSFVPCASCCSSLFDNAPLPTTEVVAFLHRRKGNKIDLPSSIPSMTNEMKEPAKVIEFIASGETVLTSSYHGVYWAQLLGRKVICVPYSAKFRSFQHSPAFASHTDWRSFLSVAQRAPDVLEEYRQINMSFAKRAADVWQ